MCVCILPIVMLVQLKKVTGSIGWLVSIEHIQADLKGNYRGVMLWNRHTDNVHIKGTAFYDMGSPAFLQRAR